MADVINPTPEVVSPSVEVPIAQPVAQTQQVAAQVPTMENGGETNPSSGFFKNLDWVEVGVGALISLTAFFVMYYYRNRVIIEATSGIQMQQQVAALQTRLTTLENEITTPNATTTATGFAG
jgi:hypothetical protein